MKNLHLIRSATTAFFAASTILLAACSTPGENPGAIIPSSPEPRLGDTALILPHEEGLYLLDPDTLVVREDIPLDEFSSVNAAGDGRHVLVTTSEGFRVLDTGTGTSEGPRLTDLVFAAERGAHVVHHEGKTALFADGTGDTTVFNSGELGESRDSLPRVETVPSAAPHHGVSVPLSDGTLLTTLGDSENRVGVRALDPSRTEISRSEECPGIHGEGVAAGERAVFGCRDGVLIYDSGEFTKVAAPDEHGRTSDQYASETSTFTVGDYSSNPDAETMARDQLVIIDTALKTSRLLTLPDGVEYTWRGVDRGTGDEAYVLGTDGALHRLDVQSGEFTDSFAVIGSWEGPSDWQEAHPALTISDGTAYVMDPETRSVHSINLVTGEIVASATLEKAPTSIARL
ncbi:zinc metallochaperone AztD [Lysinibacter sp. HNR]|uniref:zinc metallochaperone AztD n=1 Tax=Lysinibacter sp. HNR TaxID=3031408 RepID=UPI002435A470|nr:zinc metallochaperone AztD [Lysinibacter sp. HNR]WGD37063.1 zinc metallochaperone AztD [Lysinibacter sp. HNR]